MVSEIVIGSAPTGAGFTLGGIARSNAQVVGQFRILIVSTVTRSPRSSRRWGHRVLSVDRSVDRGSLRWAAPRF
jgi:hypothetical protein